MSENHQKCMNCKNTNSEGYTFYETCPELKLILCKFRSTANTFSHTLLEIISRCSVLMRYVRLLCCRRFQIARIH